jgi:type VI secretion system protein ImpH
MAPKSRQEDPAVKKPDPPQMEEILRSEPFGFDFFQAVRLLNRLLPDRTPVGLFSDPGSETVRFGAAPELGFPSSPIAGLDWPENAQPRMEVNFMGLTGPLGVLPLYYSALIRERLRAHDGALRAFFDIFNHRAISLFYRAWEKHHFTVSYERDEEDALSPHLMDLLGLGTPGLSSRQEIADEALLFRCGLLASHSRSAAGLRAILADYFGVPVEIEQFIGKWHAIEKDAQCSLGDTGADSERLGIGTVVGDEIWDQQSGIRIRLGPLTLEQYLEFLPNGCAYRPLRALVRFFAGSEFDLELQLVLKKEETPPCELGADGPTAPRLGWLTWGANAPPSMDPEDTILQI